jgi:hypothetical protein
MTNKEFITKLEVIADMSDNQVQTLANLLIDYFQEKKKKVGF